MCKQKIATEIENVILRWDETRTGNGDFGARAFLFQNKEFGHLHKNGDLDIVFGKNITAELLKENLVQKHLYVPEVGITFRVSSEEKIPFTISLLRFSYLIKANESNAIAQNIFETELAKLSESLSSTYLKQQ
jgi:hypothetical protein